MLEAAAGDSNYQSPGAEAANHKAEGLLSTQVPPELTDLNNIENLVLAETKDHWDWEMLALVRKDRRSGIEAHGVKSDPESA